MEQGLQAGLRLLESQARLEAAEDLRPAEAIRIQAGKLRVGRLVPHRHRNANLRSAARFDSVESRLADADDGESPAVHHDLLTEDAGIRAKAAAPVTVAQHRHGMAALNQVVGRGEHAAYRSADAQDRKVVAGDKIGSDQFRAALVRRTHSRGIRAEHAGEDLILVADLLVHRVGQPIGSVVAPVMVAATGQHHQLLGIPYRKRL